MTKRKILPFDWTVEWKMIVNPTIMFELMNQNSQSKENHSVHIAWIPHRPSPENKFSFAIIDLFRSSWIFLDFHRDHSSCRLSIVRWGFSIVDQVHAETRKNTQTWSKCHSTGWNQLEIVRKHDSILRKSYENSEKQAIKQLEFFHWEDKFVD